MNGVVQITLDKEFLQASTSTKVIGQLYIGLKNIDNKPEYNHTAVFGEFNFEVADALINKVSAFTKVEYIRMFDKLRDEIKTRTKEMEDDIGNIKTLVNEVKDAVTDGKADITKIKNDSISELETIANTTNTSVQQQASQAISDIQSIVDEYTTKLNDETEDKINQVNEESDKVIEAIKGNNVVTKDETDGWQKYKLTNDDGRYTFINLNSDLLTLQSLDPGYYYTANTPGMVGSSTGGFTHVEHRDSLVKRITFRPYNSTQEFIMRYNNTWGDWELVNTTQTDTGWVPFNLINGTLANDAFKNESDNGFDCAYRTITNGSVTEKRVRINAKNITHLQQIAQLPGNF